MRILPISLYCLRKSSCNSGYGEIGLMGFSPLLSGLYRQQQMVDYKQVDAHVHQFKGSSARYLFSLLITASYAISFDYGWGYNLDLFLMHACKKHFFDK